MHLRRTQAFTLLEMAIVVLILGMILAAVFRYSANVTATNNNAALVKTLDAIETALRNYRVSQAALPCPSNLNVAENAAIFGVAAGTVGDGNCTGVNFINWGTDPDNADPLYDATTLGQIVEGGVPTKELKIDDKYAYDPWGRKLFYVVDKRMTKSNAFNSHPLSDNTIGGIVIKKNASDTLANAITYTGVYALISTGGNGHGGYVRNVDTASAPYNAGSTNVNEQKNCHCDASATPTTFDRVFVQATKTGSTTISNQFDDTVRCKNRIQMATYNELQ